MKLLKLNLFMNSSWDDEASGNKNAKSGTLPDGDLFDTTSYSYCTYGPSFRILFFFFVIFHFLCYLIFF